MSFDNLDAHWGQATANIDEGGSYGDDQPPAPGVHTAVLKSSRTGATKAGETYFAVDFALQSGQSWGVFKSLTKGGVIDEGRAKSAAILLRGLGLAGIMPSQIGAALKGIEGSFFFVETKQSNQINTTTGQYYVNTDVGGPAQGWPATAPTPVAAPVAQPVAPVPAQMPAVAFPGPSLDQTMAQGADHPFDTPAQGVQPSGMQGTAG